MRGIDLSVRAAQSTLDGLRLDAEEASTVEAFARCIWSMLIEPGDSVAGRLIAAHGAADALGRMLGGESARTEGITDAELALARDRWLPRCDAASVRAAADAARRAGVRLLVPGDADWPPRLDDLGVHAPVALWARGDTSMLAAAPPAVAIVGARAATSYGEHVAGEFAAELAASGVTIVSGAAYGIDGVAHRAALRVGGRTVALLAGGVDRAYPTGHTALIETIAERGLLLAESPCGAAPTKWRFLARNRLIAAASDATVVVEAGTRSGSLNTAAHAAALGRALGAVPGAITSTASAGCHRILREFDGVCLTSPADVRELLGLGTREQFVLQGGRTDETSRVLDALSTRVSRNVAEIARRSGLGEHEVQAVIALAAVSGDARETSTGWQRVTSVR